MSSESLKFFYESLRCSIIVPIIKIVSSFTKSAPLFGVGTPIVKFRTSITLHITLAVPESLLSERIFELSFL